jgi:hypothetical protein
MSNHYSAANLRFPGADALLDEFPYLGPPNLYQPGNRVGT